MEINLAESYINTEGLDSLFSSEEEYNGETFLAEIEERSSVIDDEWTIGTQTTDEDGEILSRTYTFLSTLDKPGRIQRVELGRYDETYENTFYYLVMRYFIEDSYLSLTADFVKWGMTRVEMRQDLYYKHKEIGCLYYERPYEDRSLLTLVGETEETTIYRHYLPLASPTSIYLYVGKAVGIVINSEDPIQIYKKDTRDGIRIESGFSAGEVILCDRDYIEVEFSPTNSPELLSSFELGCRLNPCTGETIYINQTENVCALSNSPLVSHEYIVFRIYGEFLWNGYTPGYVNEMETYLHPLDTNDVDRLKPPGKPNVREDFWNSNMSTVRLPTINTRLTTEPYLS